MRVALQIARNLLGIEMGGLLMSRLRARRHVAALAPRAGGAVANGEDVVVARRLQRRPNHELIDAVGLEPSDVL